jgi:cardiolipin synthase
MTMADSGYVIPYADNPVDDENVGRNVYIDMLNQAKEYVYIMTPYLILDGEMLSAITFAAKRGVDVRIILPHIPDKWYAFVLAQSNYKDLLEAGVKVYEYTPGFVHAKVFISDDERAVVGSVNLDYRSLYWHYECAAYLYRVPAITDIYKDFMDTQNLCEEVTSETIKKIGIFSKTAAYILKIVAPLM